MARGSRVKALLDAALTAGKAARDPQRVPKLEALRQYGSGSSRYSCEPPAHLSEAAATAAAELAIEPSVEQCLAKFQAMEQSSAINSLRQKAELMANTLEEARFIKQQLHQPTMDLRQGLRVDEHHLLVTLQSGLQAMRYKADSANRE